MSWPTEWPAQLVPLDADGRAAGDPVEATQLRPGRVGEAAAWSGGVEVIVNGGPALLLPDGVVGLGDYVVRRDGRAVAEPADGISQRYAPIEDAETGEQVNR